MKSISKRTGACLIAVLLIVSIFAGCASGAQQPVESSAPAPSSSGEAVSEPAGLSPDKPVTLSCFINYTWYPIDKWEGIIPEEITKRTGITLDITKAVDAQQLGLMIASGDLPDIVATDVLLSSLSTDDLCYAYNDLIDQYGLDWDIDQIRKANALSFSQSTDKFYTVLSHFASTEDWRTLQSGAPMNSSILYRADLLEAMGNPKLETPEDLKNVLMQVKSSYPDLIPLVFSQDVWRFQLFKEMFGIGGSNVFYVQNADGNWVTYVKHERYKEMLRYLNDLYRNGLITADNFAMNTASVTALMQSGKAFARSDETQDTINTDTAAIKKVDPNAVIKEAPLLGDLNGYKESSIGWNGTFISKNCSNPEAAIRYMQFLNSDEGMKLTQWGREGVDYTLDEKGVPTFSDQWNQATLDGSLDTVFNTRMYFAGSKLLEAVARCASTDEALVPNYKQLRENFQNLPWLLFAVPKEGSDERIVYDKLFAFNGGYLGDAEAKCILSDNDQSFENNFNELMTTAGSIGMNDLEQYMNTKIHEAMDIYGVS